MAQLTCQNLSLGYDAKIILRDLSFSVHAGDYLCIVGENGSGKSTLMKTILGLQAPIRGEVLTGDGLKPNEIGYLPQQTVVQKDFPASVREIVLSGCQGRCGLRPFYNREEKRIAAQTATYENYRPDERFRLENALVLDQGRYLLFSASPDNSAIEKLFEQSLQ